MRKALIIGLMLVMVSGFSAVAPAHAGEAPDVSASRSFPALDEFHEVMARMWHTHLPDKDFDAVRNEVPDLVKRMAALGKAELPGVFRERAEDFVKQRESLAKSVEDLAKIAEAKDDQALSQAVVRMHQQFHGLVMVLFSRPKSVEEFHAVLYMMWHKDYPEKDTTTLKGRILDLQAGMKAVMEQELTGRYSAPKDEFEKARSILNEKVDALAGRCSGENEDEIWAALKEMHDAFRAMDHLFDR